MGKARQQQLMRISLKYLLLSFLILLPYTLAGFVIDVPHQDESCFFIRIEKESTVDVNFDLLNDDLSPDPLRVVLLDNKMDTLYKTRQSLREGRFEITSRPGRLSLCVQNGIDHGSRDRADRTVGLDVRVVGVPDPTQHLLKSVTGVQTKLWNLKNHHDYMRTREAHHRSLTEDTFTQIGRWTILEAASAIVVSILQVWYMRRFFETRRYV
eukprot:CAMPEP_0202442812 /NCGR_PEP_ID=MMETSP1360-20130828/2178_1 /ASSEMBLY_ACC=CAM_ASM_000848 /TAXON_ID=515479 /ORGANISM="Licmophora paradoxa, Strain CCMP2313" /LENGTH=210 /DNA_ID=CAMNT_0049058273 /DNA_START=16 /DNA_END=648 /DNA_ORIENTATION=+